MDAQEPVAGVTTLPQEVAARSAAAERHACIQGVGMYVPERLLTNADLERMVETSDEWITERTGIRTRHLAEDGVATSDLGASAASRALEDAGLSAEDLDLIICATVTPDMLFPATASLIQNQLGASRAAAFDLGAGCTGFIYGMVVASQFIANRAAEHVLVVGAEVLSKITDWTDRSTCVLFGDGAGAVVMGPCVPADGGLLAYEIGSDGSGWNALYLPAGGSRQPSSSETVAQRLHYLKMDGREVFKFAVRAMSEATERILVKAGLGPEDVSLLIPHQANSRITEAAAKRFSLSPEKVVANIDRYGNTSSASIPIALRESLDEGRVHHGDHVVLVAFGAGLTWGAVVIRWV